ncbi:MAG: efflux RND transporter periplasmic adaptor subunit [Deltaproteobacteria bacterium]|nr:efflux RND transporter periplasmic adaptor subunit [Deltaproteobacteria bacterium]
MKLKLLLIPLLAAVIAGGGIYYWHHSHHNQHTNTPTHQHTKLYHCPMHPTYTSDKPGQCPICGMNLVPIEEEKPDSEAEKQSSANEQKTDAHADRTDVTISFERQQMIGVKTGTIKKAPAIKEIRTVASVSFNPELAVAQTEYLEAKELGQESLISAAHDRLLVLGMNDGDIKTLKEVQRSRFLPDKDSWIYPVIYEYELPYVKQGQTVDIELPGNKSYAGIVRSIDTVIDPMTRSARLHVEIKTDGQKINPYSFGSAKIKIDLGEKILIPKSAIIASGERNLAFMVHEGTHFMPMEVKLGAELGDYYVLEDGLNEGDTVVTSANFLIDSESKLKAAIGGATGGGGGGHKH